MQQGAGTRRQVGGNDVLYHAREAALEISGGPAGHATSNQGSIRDGGDLLQWPRFHRLLSRQFRDWQGYEGPGKQRSWRECDEIRPDSFR
jgi:hypothetical protein